MTAEWIDEWAVVANGTSGGRLVFALTGDKVSADTLATRLRWLGLFALVEHVGGRALVPGMRL